MRATTKLRVRYVDVASIPKVLLKLTGTCMKITDRIVGNVFITIDILKKTFKDLQHSLKKIINIIYSSKKFK